MDTISVDTAAFIYATVVYFLQALTDEQKAKLTEFKGACITESGVDPRKLKIATYT